MGNSKANIYTKNTDRGIAKTEKKKEKSCSLIQVGKDTAQKAGCVNGVVLVFIGYWHTKRLHAAISFSFYSLTFPDTLDQLSINYGDISG